MDVEQEAWQSPGGIGNLTLISIGNASQLRPSHLHMPPSPSTPPSLTDLLGESPGSATWNGSALSDAVHELPQFAAASELRAYVAALGDTGNASWNESTLTGALYIGPAGEIGHWAFFIALLVLVTFFGNLLVLITIHNNERLHKPRHYFVYNLALTDLLLSVLILPLSGYNTLTSRWVLGAVACNLFVGTDVMLCTVSILMLFVISLERFLAIRHSFLYARAVNTKRVKIVIGAIWVFSAVLAYVPIFLGWNTASGRVQNNGNPKLCIFENGNATYVLAVAIGTFFLPLLMMFAVYGLIFTSAKKQTRRINSQYSSVHNPSGRGKGPTKSSASCPASDDKAARVLGIVMATFVVCWFPYFVLFSMKPFFTDWPWSLHVEFLVLWLGYANSAMNPFLYAFCSAEFKYGFLKVLCRKRAVAFREAHPELHA